MKRGVWLLVGLGVVGAACSTTAGTTTTSTSTTPTSTSSSTTAPATTLPPNTTTTQPARFFDQVAYFFTGDPPRLVPYVVRVPGTSPQVILDALARSPSLVAGATTALSSEMMPQITGITDRVASVSLPEAFTTGTADEVRARLAQVVYSLTRLPEVWAVQFLVDDVPVEEVGGVPVEARTRRFPIFDDLLGPLLIDEPAAGQAITPAVHVEVMIPGGGSVTPVEISLTTPAGMVTGLYVAEHAQKIQTDLEFCSDEAGPGTLEVTVGDVSTTQSVTLSPTPERQPCRPLPLTTLGWEMQPGDLLTASEEAGVSIVRDGSVVATPVTNPALDAVATGPGEIVVDLQHYQEGADLWLIRPDAPAHRIYRGTGHLNLLGMLTLPGFGPGRWLAFTETGPLCWAPNEMGAEWCGYWGYGWGSITRWLVLLNLENESHLALPISTGEGGCTGIAGMGDYVVMSASSEGIFWFEALDRVGAEVALPHNPAPYHGVDDPGQLRALVGIPGTRLWAFAASDDYTGFAEDFLVIYDPSSGREITRSAVPGSALEEVMVWEVDASSEAVVVTATRWDRSAGWLYTAHLFDLASGTWTSFAVPGTARLVPQWVPF